MIFTFVFWTFSFLRMGTTGLTAQALDAGDLAEVRANLGRPLLIAVALGLVLILIQQPMLHVALLLLEASPVVETLAGEYFRIRIWSGPGRRL